MSQTTQLKVSMEEQSAVLKIYEQYKDKPGTIPQEIRDALQGINNHLWDIKKSETAEYKDKLAAFEQMAKVHALLGKKFDEAWRPREPKGPGGGKGGWTASKQQRIQNCDDLKEYLSAPRIQVWNSLSPFEQAQILAKAWGSVKQ